MNQGITSYQIRDIVRTTLCNTKSLHNIVLPFGTESLLNCLAGILNILKKCAKM